MTPKSLRTIYNSLVLPHLCYCHTVWGSAYKKYLTSLQCMQKKIIRVISFKNMYHPSADLFQTLYLLNLDQIKIYTCSIQVFKSLTSSDNMFSFQESVHNTRSTNAVSLPNILSSHSRQSVRWIGSVVWNGLPSDLRHLQQSLPTLKYKLKRHLIEGLWCVTLVFPGRGSLFWRHFPIVWSFFFTNSCKLLDAYICIIWSLVNGL